MKTYEFPATVTAEGNLELPDTLVKLLPANETVRVIVVVSEAPAYERDLPPDEEDELWQRINAEQLLKQYNEADAIYDTL